MYPSRREVMLLVLKEIGNRRRLEAPFAGKKEQALNVPQVKEGATVTQVDGTPVTGSLHSTHFRSTSNSACVFVLNRDMNVTCVFDRMVCS